MVCRASFGHRGCLQDLRRELSQRSALAANPARSAVRDRASFWRLSLCLQCFRTNAAWPVASWFETGLFVMAGFIPAIHVFLDLSAVRRGCPAQGHGCPV